jgi:hemerythrin-like domain-containing protein
LSLYSQGDAEVSRRGKLDTAGCIQGLCREANQSEGNGMVGVQIGAKPDSGFNDPIGMLKDCHRRIENFLQILCLVAERARGRRLTDEEATAVNASLSYFRAGGQRHTADEEESLFPRLKKQLSSDEVEQLHRLEDDHERANELHAEIEELYHIWMESGLLSEHNEKILTQSVTELEGIYKAHIKVEEEVVFPQASRTLDPKAVEAMGQEFRARRT